MADETMLRTTVEDLDETLDKEAQAWTAPATRRVSRPLPYPPRRYEAAPPSASRTETTKTSPSPNTTRSKHDSIHGNNHELANVVAAIDAFLASPDGDLSDEEHGHEQDKTSNLPARPDTATASELNYIAGDPTLVNEPTSPYRRDNKAKMISQQTPVQIHPEDIGGDRVATAELHLEDVDAESTYSHSDYSEHANDSFEHNVDDHLDLSDRAQRSSHVDDSYYDEEHDHDRGLEHSLVDGDYYDDQEDLEHNDEQSFMETEHDDLHEDDIAGSTTGSHADDNYDIVSGYLDENDGTTCSESGSSRRTSAAVSEPASERKTSMRTEALIKAAARAVVASIEKNEGKEPLDLNAVSRDALAQAKEKAKQDQAEASNEGAKDVNGSESESDRNHTTEDEDGQESDDVFSDRSPRTSLGSWDGSSGEDRKKAVGGELKKKSMLKPALRPSQRTASHIEAAAAIDRHRSPRVSDATTGSISNMSHYERGRNVSNDSSGSSDNDPDLPANFKRDTSRVFSRPAFRSPSAVRALQMSSPTPSVVYNGRGSIGAQNFNSSPTHRRRQSQAIAASYHFSPHSPSSSHKRSTPFRVIPPDPAPLVLLHATLMPTRWVWADVLRQLDGAECSVLSPALQHLHGSWCQLEDFVGGDTVTERGVLLPHPQNDFEVLEERLLEALELPVRRRARILECGHYLGPEDVDGEDYDDDDNQTEKDFSGSRDSQSQKHWCTTCHSEIRYESLGSDRAFRVKVYASNGLMTPGAWAACWREMERVDVEVEPIVGDASIFQELAQVRAALEARKQDEQRIAREMESSAYQQEDSTMDNADVTVEHFELPEEDVHEPVSPPLRDSPTEPEARTTTDHERLQKTRPMERGVDLEEEIPIPRSFATEHTRFSHDEPCEPTTANSEAPTVAAKSPLSPSEEAFERREERRRRKSMSKQPDTQGYQGASLPQLLLAAGKVLVRDHKPVVVTAASALAVLGVAWRAAAGSSPLPVVPAAPAVAEAPVAAAPAAPPVAHVPVADTEENIPRVVNVKPQPDVDDVPAVANNHMLPSSVLDEIVQSATVAASMPVEPVAGTAATVAPRAEEKEETKKPVAQEAHQAEEPHQARIQTQQPQDAKQVPGDAPSEAAAQAAHSASTETPVASLESASARVETVAAQPSSSQAGEALTPAAASVETSTAAVQASPAVSAVSDNAREVHNEASSAVTTISSASPVMSSASLSVTSPAAPTVAEDSADSSASVEPTNVETVSEQASSIDTIPSYSETAAAGATSSIIEERSVKMDAEDDITETSTTDVIDNESVAATPSVEPPFLADASETPVETVSEAEPTETGSGEWIVDSDLVPEATDEPERALPSIEATSETQVETVAIPESTPAAEEVEAGLEDEIPMPMPTLRTEEDLVPEPTAVTEAAFLDEDEPVEATSSIALASFEPSEAARATDTFEAPASYDVPEASEAAQVAQMAEPTNSVSPVETTGTTVTVSSATTEAVWSEGTSNAFGEDVEFETIGVETGSFGAPCITTVTVRALVPPAFLAGPRRY